MEGQLTNGSFADYKIPTLLDMPDKFINEYIESRQADGPFGAKGAGESHDDRPVSPGDRKCAGRRDRRPSSDWNCPLTQERFPRLADSDAARR